MDLAPLPPTAAWRHRDAHDGFETTFFETGPDGVRIRGDTAAVDEGEPWSVRYDIRLDAEWRTRHVIVSALTSLGSLEVTLEADGAGRWRLNGSNRPDLDDCFDVDLESSACTNTLPVHRLALAVGKSAEAPAVYVRAVDLTVERLEQQYLRLDDEDGCPRFDYRSPRFEFHDVLVFDESGLVLDYPGIATRVST